MTTTQKALIATTLAAALGTGVYELAKNSRLQNDLRRMEQKFKPLTEQNEQLLRERDKVGSQLVGLRDDNERLNRNASELLKLRDEVARLRKNSKAEVSNPRNKIFDASDPNWRPNWIALRPFNLAQFPDSGTEIERASAIDAGIATPAALLQTWIWAQRINDASSILRTWDFPEGTTEGEKMEEVRDAQRTREISEKNPNVGYMEQSKLRDLFVLGDDYFLAFIEDKGLNTATFVTHQIFRRVGNEWKVSFGKTSK